MLLLLLLLVEGGALFLLDLDPPTRVAFAWGGVVILWVGLSHRALARYLDRVLPWEEAMAQRLWVQIGLATLLALGGINITYFLAKVWFLDVTPDRYQFLVLNLYGLFIILPVIFVNGAFFVLMQWRRSMLYSEQLKQENVRGRLESLKNHLDPHFLFNNLNILSSLIDKDPDAAQDFLAAFSEVYRYVLRSKGEELVSLDRELEVVDAYIYMLRQRFPGGLEIRTEVSAAARNRYVPPLAVQMLIENAIKHNRVSEQQPLHIAITAEGDRLKVQNNRQPKPLAEPSSRFGLSNIRKRYAYLSGDEIEVSQTEAEFFVCLPLLSLNS
ncbi:MAG: histidine kinase [Bacteroidetes bacterium]|nr:MAG: histidine kinase [Bacteroidota bacterium]